MGRYIDLTGNVFGNLEVIERAPTSAYGGTMWKCICDCGTICIEDGGNLRRNKVKSCGCQKYIDLTGQKFNRLLVKAQAGRYGNGSIKWLCLCDCGNETYAEGHILKENIVRSCGCYMKEAAAIRSTTHGLSRTPEYRIWNSMITRCQSHPRYAGRGIKVCERWVSSFENFYADMGPRPSVLHSIDREDNDGNYEPGNCRWVTKIVQSFNKGLASSNKTGIKGVAKLKCGGYLAELTINGNKVLKRQFKSLVDAGAARREAEEQYSDAMEGK